MTTDASIRQMRNVVLIIGLAWLCIGVPVLIGVATVGGSVWSATPVVVTLAGCALAITGAALTWLLRSAGPPIHVVGAGLVLAKNTAYRQGSGLLDVPWGYLIVLAIFLAVVAPNWSVFRSHHA